MREELIIRGAKNLLETAKLLLIWTAESDEETGEIDEVSQSAVDILNRSIGKLESEMRKP